MKSVLTLAVALVLCAVPAFAADGNVSQETLSALGLTGMQTLSDVDGMQIRGRSSSFGIVKGTSLIFGQLLTPDTKNFVVGSSVNEVDANAETTASGGLLTLTKDHEVFLDLNLAVDYPDGTYYSGLISGFAGGVGSVGVMQP